MSSIAYQHEIYDWCKANGICTRCRKEPAAIGFNTCAACQYKCWEYAVTRRESEDVRQRERASSRAWRERCKEKSICTGCGHEPARPGRILCAECARRQKRADAERIARRRAQRPSREGLCKWCDNPAVDGKKFCAACLPRMQAVAEHMRQAGREKQVGSGAHPWVEANQILFRHATKEG